MDGYRSRELGHLYRSIARPRPLRTRSTGRGHDEGREHLHSLFAVRLAVPHARHHDAAVRFLSRMRLRARSQSQDSICPEAARGPERVDMFLSAWIPPLFLGI